MSQFKTRDVENSIQRFRDYSRDLIEANMNTFNDRLNKLIHFCKEDPVFSNIHDQLLDIETQNIEEWYEERVSQAGAMAGSASLDFPTALQQRTSLQYKLLLALQNETISFDKFTKKFFVISSNKINAYIREFISAIVEPLCRELEYKLQEIEEDLPDDNTRLVSSRAIQVFKNEGDVIQQTAVGESNIQQADQSGLPSEVECLFDELIQQINSEVEEKNDRKEALEVIETAKEEMKKSEPNQTIVQSLLNSLPQAEAIVSLTTEILQYV
jgi:hypothetical protein